MTLLTVNNLSVKYGQTLAVDRVSFSIGKGEIFALVGESGSGKSTIGLALTKLLPQPPATIAGEVLLEGKSILGLSGEALRAIRGGKISYVFQEPASALNPVLTIGEQLEEMILLHDKHGQADARTAAMGWLKRVGIGD